jgi:hypothetical protein
VPYLKTDTDKDSDKDKDNDMDKGTDKKTDTDTHKHGHKLGIGIGRLLKDIKRRYSTYGASWITCDTSRCKFRRRNELVVLLPHENYDMHTHSFKISYRRWNC